MARNGSNGSEFKFASLCRVARLDRGMSQGKLAAAIGVTQPSIACMENRGKPMGEDTLDKVADALGFATTIDMLVHANAIAQRDGVA